MLLNNTYLLTNPNWQQSASWIGRAFCVT